MKKLPVLAQVFVVGMVATAAVLLSVCLERPQWSQLPVFVGLLAGTMVTSVFKLRLPTTKNRATLSVSFVLDFMSLLLLGPHQAMLIAAIGALMQSKIRIAGPNPLHRVLFNVATLVVTVQGTGLIYRLAGGTLGALVWPQDAPALVAATIAYFLINSGSIAIAVALSTYQPLRRVWQENFLWGAPSFFIGAAMAALLTELVGRQLWTMLPVAGVPVYLTYRAYSAFASRLEDEHRHREVIESLNEGMAVVHADGRIGLWNDALERILGIARGEALGRTLLQAVPALAQTILPQTVITVLETGQTDTLEHFALACTTGRRILQVRLFPFTRGVTLFWSDITDRSHAEAALKQSEERFALAAAGANDGLWDWDLTRGEIYFSPRWHEMLGLAPAGEKTVPESWLRRIHPDDLASFTAALQAHITGETAHFQHEHRTRHEDGTYRSVLCRGAVVRKADGRATRIAGSLTDVTERAVAQEQLRHQALHDHLTGLPNRALFMELLSQVLERGHRHPDQMFAVLFLDLDRFKVINDSLGHLIADDLLVAISRRFESCLREGDVLARLGGDEFTILLNDLGDVSQASVIAERIHETLRAPFALTGREIYTTVSVGIALSPTGYTRPEHVMRDADTAMYRAKALGKARHELFDASMHTQALDRLSLENDLRRSIDRGDFALHYQPIVSLETGAWTGFEALVRWQRGGRVVAPDEFIPIAEETGLIEPLGTWILREACRQSAAWRAQFPTGPALGITVNVSTRQLTHPDFLATVRSAVADMHLQLGDLRLEITETALMDDPARAEVVLRELRAAGVKVYLDDFGTGFSSLSYLHRFPVDTLKIDRSFVGSIGGATHHPAFIESILALAKSLGTQVIAEGVETEEQRHELLRMGCREAQGYLFSRPLSAHSAEAFLARHHVGAPMPAPAAPAPYEQAAA
jgi:diguanylate cyclase (GGDEF)-like protein/PAS domain S-box-containing protein